MLPGSAASRYANPRLLRSGETGTTLRAFDTLLERMVVIRLLGSNVVDGVRDEVASLAKVDHPSVVRIFEFQEEEGAVYYTMEDVQGTPLETLERGRTLPLSQVVHLAVRLADAVETLHEHGLLHRDIEPRSIVVTPHGVPKFVDFGLARGVARYQPPELAANRRHTVRSDVYQLGVLVYEALTGQIPPLAGPVRRPSFYRSDIDLLLDSIVFQAVSPAPEERPESAANLRDAFRRWLGHRPA